MISAWAAIPYTSLAGARQAAFEHRKRARAGGDPRALARRVPTFADAADKVIAIHRASWRPGSKSEAQWAGKPRRLRNAETRQEACRRAIDSRRDGRPTADLEHQGGDGTEVAAADIGDHEVGDSRKGTVPIIRQVRPWERLFPRTRANGGISKRCLTPRSPQLSRRFATPAPGPAPSWPWSFSS